MFDTLIKGGKVIDGESGASRVADIAIARDRIAEIAPSIKATAKKTVDASGLTVVPGFVDIHSHADLVLHRTDHKEILAPLVKQGITTFVGGNCGMALAPLRDKNIGQVADYIEAFTARPFTLTDDWNTTSEYYDFLDRSDLLLNAGILTPHSILRINAVGLQTRLATAGEVKEMKADLEESLKAGSLGLSTGLMYFPGSQSDTDELLALSEVIRDQGGIFTSHLRSYFSTLREAIDEVIAVSKHANIPAQISHIFWLPDMGAIAPYLRKAFRGLSLVNDIVDLPIPMDSYMQKMLRHIKDENSDGAQVGIDALPSTTAFTHLLALYPPWVMVGTREEIIGRLKDPKQRAVMLRQITKSKAEWPHLEPDQWSMNIFKLMGWESIWIMAVQNPGNKVLEGRRLTDIAAERKKHPFDVACDLLIEEDGKVLVFMSISRPDDAFTEKSTYSLMRDEIVSIATDSVLLGFGRPSFLFHGGFPRYLRRYVYDRKMISLEDAIAKTSTLPARQAGIRDRGVLAKGKFADVVIFDEDEIGTKGNFFDPAHDPDGIRHVFINGGHAVDNGRLTTKKLHGRLIKKT